MSDTLQVAPSAIGTDAARGRPAARDSTSRAQLALAAVAVAIAYYAGARLGFLLTFQPYPVSVLWPPNALLMAALLLMPARHWWVLLLAAFPVHLAVELSSGVPMAMVLAWFASNCFEAVLGAACVRRFVSGPLRLDSFSQVGIFLLAAVLAAPLLSSFLDAGLVALIGWGGNASYWQVFSMRFMSNALSVLVFVPLVLTWANDGWRNVMHASAERQFEVAGIFLGLVVASTILFEWKADADIAPALLYLPLPLLLWAAVRLGPQGIASAFALLALVAIWGAAQGHGPFATGASAIANARSVQAFLIAIAVPLLMFAAVMAERRRSADALRLSEDRWLKVFRFSPDAVVIVREDNGTIVDVNEQWEALMGFARDQAVGRTAPELGLYRNSADRGTYFDLASRGHVREFAVDMVDRQGNVHHTKFTGGRVQVGDVPCLITIIRDMTAQVRSEREAQEQKLEVMHLGRVVMLGELSGSLAHELNQPLTAILSNAQAAQRLLAHGQPDTALLREILQDIVAEDRRAGDVIRRLRALFRKDALPFQVLDVNELAQDTLTLAHGDLVTRGVHISTQLSSHPVLTRGDRVQLQQVLLNLIANAVEAMEAGNAARVLEISTAPTPEGQVQIFVKDSGPGIPAVRADKLFEPFFTTKQHGLGLGLSISRSIVEAHGGKLTARNNAGSGATFRLVLPAASRPEAGA
jgi:PAS domain S-box-containing protein